MCKMKKKLLFSVVLVISVLMVAGCKNSASGGVGSSGGTPAGTDRDKNINISMINISGGNVPLTNTYNPTVSSFSMSQTEITQKQWREVMGNNGFGDDKPSDGDNYPMYNVSWYDAIVFCNKLSVKEGKTPCYSLNGNKDAITNATPPNEDSRDWNRNVGCDWNVNGYRLPTEAEWEYAARAGNAETAGNQYGKPATESTLGNYAWYNDSSTHPVGKKTANAFGLYDMSGNVAEWCWDWLSFSYDTAQRDNPKGVSSGDSRVNRGGSWDHPTSYCTVSKRGYIGPESRDVIFGFRIVCRP